MTKETNPVMVQRVERIYMKVSDIKFDESNPNRMSDKEEKALSLSFNRFGYVYQIVVDKKTKIIADGAHRLKDLIKRGETEIQVIVIDFKNDAERRLFRQITKKVQGHHDDILDAEEFKIIMADDSTDMEDFAESIAQSEQGILNIINRAEEEDKKALKDDVEDVDQLGSVHITCPKCKHRFKKRKD